NTDESAIIVRGNGNLTVTGGRLNKTGNSSNVDASNFTGQNAVVLVGDGNAVLNNIEIVSDGEGANAVFSTGKNSKITLQNGKIITKKDSSRGLDATYGGSITAMDFEISTEGAHSGAVATDRGEGSITVARGKLITRGDGSPCIYSTGNISVTDSTGEAFGSEIAVVEGKNSITLERVNLTGHEKNGVMLYQSFSGDADVGEATLFARDSTLTNRSNGAMFFVTNTKAVITLERVGLNQDGNVLIKAAKDRWGSDGQNGGDFTFNAKNEQLKGDVLVDSLSKARMNLSQNTNWTGSLNKDNKASFVSLYLDGTSRLVLTADSYITELSGDDTEFKNIESNGFTIYYDKEKSPSLGGRTINLSGGGRIMPKNG
ncbi:MAG: hypothetical protein J6I62_04445, partial [Selenomonadaceae bacterium]|nr:hypothetical protein [Selenomonadaceae bacterium]